MIAEEDFNKIVEQVRTSGLSESLIDEFREQYSDYHFTYCMDDDMEANKAFIETSRFNVYLVNSQDHCSTITTQLDAASGLVLAEIVED